MSDGRAVDETAARRALARTLAERRGEIAALGVVVGFDGFIDELISVVGERRGVDEYSALPSMAELGRLVSAAAGRNSLREIVVRGHDPGGCAVNLGDGLAALGVAVDFFGTIGDPPHPAFAPFVAACRSATAWTGVHGRTLAFEFADGKFMFSAVAQLAELSEAAVRAALADGAFARACAGARLIAFTNWTLYPHMTAVWRLLRDEVLARLGQRPWLFVDLVDPSSRAADDVRAMLALLPTFAPACRVVLGVNRTELAALARIVAVESPDADGGGLAASAAALRARLGIARVVVHGARRNALADADGALLEAPAGPWCARPRKTTGAGDRFNAGYGLGLMLDLPHEHALALGSAVAGFFVRQARSPRFDEVVAALGDRAGGAIATG